MKPHTATKRRLVIVFVTIIGVHFSFFNTLQAQGDRNYQTEYAQLHKAYVKNPNDIATLVALADHYSQPANPQYDIAQAGRHIHRAESLFEKYLQDDSEYNTVRRLFRKDITLMTIRQRYRAIDSAAYAYLRTHAQELDESELSSFAEAFADNKTIHTFVKKRWVAKAYSRAKAENTIDAYYAFSQEHPGTLQADSAERRMAALAPAFFAQFENETDIMIAAGRYPKNSNIQHAAMLQSSRIAYAEASQVNTVEAYSAYTERFPQGANYVQAIMRIDDLNATEFNALSTPEDYAGYAHEHIDHPLADSALARLRQMILEDKNSQAAQLYLEQFPLDPAYSDIYKEYYRWHAEEGNEAPLRRFADENPNYPYRITLEADMARARGIDTIDLLKPYSEAGYEEMSTNIYKLTGRRIALVGLQRILQAQLARQDWKGAKERWQHFDICFEENNTKEYDALGHLIVAAEGSAPRQETSAGAMVHPLPTPNGRVLYFTQCRNGVTTVAYARHSNKKNALWAYAGDVVVKGLKGTPTLCNFYDKGKHVLLSVDGDIHTARVENDSLWVMEERLPYPVNTDALELDACFLANDAGILLASDRQGGHNHQPSRAYFHGDTALATDLYFVPRTATGWGEPVNLGIHVNTPYCELSPLLSRNMRTLYFISDGHMGLGYGDIFYVSRTNTDDWTHWSEPVNLGKGINGPFAEQSIAFAEGEHRLFVSSATAKPGNNICNSVAIKHDTTSNFRSVTVDLSSMKGKVQRVEVIDLTRQSVVQILTTNAQTTKQTILLDRNHRYAVLARVPGLFVPAVKVSSPMPKSIAFKGYTPQQALNTSIALGATPYDGNARSYRLKAIADHELRQLALFMHENPKLYVQIEVNINGSDDQYCYNASVELATVIRTRLAELGVATERVRLAGYGNIHFKKGKKPATISVRFLDKI